jgi:hypothetical protein
VLSCKQLCKITNRIPTRAQEVTLIQYSRDKMRKDAVISIIALLVVGALTFFLFPRPDAVSPLAPDFSPRTGTVLGERTQDFPAAEANDLSDITLAFFDEVLRSSRYLSNQPVSSSISAALTPSLRQELPESNPAFAQTVLTALNLPLMPEQVQIAQVSQFRTNRAEVRVDFFYPDRVTLTRSVELEHDQESWKVSRFTAT